MKSAVVCRIVFGAAFLAGAWGGYGVRDALAAEDHEKGRWGIGVLGGFYKPSLATLNRVLTEPSLAIIQDPNQQLQPNVDFPPEVRNLYVTPFDEKYGFTLGLEGKYRYLPRHAFHLTLNLWHSETLVSDVVPFVTGANVNEPDLVRRESLYDIQISQLWLGWRYTVWQPSQKQTVYLDVGLLGLAFGKLTINTLLKENNPAVVATPFAVASSMEANGFGLTTRWGVGGEYQLTNWLGISARADYIVGEIPQLSVVRFFRAGFAVPPPPEAVISLPPPPEEGDTVTFADVQRAGNNPNTEVATSVESLPLELNGLEVMFGIHFYF
jgi:hypothetical protein